MPIHTAIVRPKRSRWRLNTRRYTANPSTAHTASIRYDSAASAPPERYFGTSSSRLNATDIHTPHQPVAFVAAPPPPALRASARAAADTAQYATAAPMLDMSTGQPIAVRPKNGTAADTATTSRIALRGAPRPSRRPIHAGNTLYSESPCSSRLVASTDAMMPVDIPANIADASTATPAVPSARRAAAKVGIDAIPSSRFAPAR